MARRGRVGGLSRRAVIAGLGGALIAPRRLGAAEALTAILERSGLGARTGFAVAEATTGAVLEAHQADLDRPPASAVKIVTALYALDRLGPSSRFETRLAASGPRTGGTLAGDLTLVGGGDPLLDTDALGEMAAEARAGGLTAVAGRFLVAADALPTLREIEPDQPAHAGYNPAISGLNLNFNRVHLAWSPGPEGPVLAMSAPGALFSAETPTIRAELGGAGPPRHRIEAGREIWAFAPRSLKGSGSLWLPVRAPAAYAGAAFRGLAAQGGLALAAPESGPAPEGGASLARRASPPLDAMLRDMLKYSTNLTAEVAGLRAAGGADLAASAAAMTDWARARYGLRRAALVNHSGLTARSAMSASEMVRLLVAEAGGALPGMLKERPLRDAAGAPYAVPGVRVLAKTGTLNFVSALAGYLEGPGERRRAFAIFAADPERRAAIAPEASDDPPGAADWARRARAQEMALLRRWIAQA
jgi:D-alanyl-D-alanine carboxypeptidase/D-alanyl-D-alanine-endopeptidase (penicillin-binding protein 4)